MGTNVSDKQSNYPEKEVYFPDRQASINSMASVGGFPSRLDTRCLSAGRQCCLKMSIGFKCPWSSKPPKFLLILCSSWFMLMPFVVLAKFATIFIKLQSQVMWWQWLMICGSLRFKKNRTHYSTTTIIKFNCIIYISQNAGICWEQRRSLRKYWLRIYARTQMLPKFITLVMKLSTW